MEASWSAIKNLSLTLACFFTVFFSGFNPGTACPDDWVQFKGTGMCYKFVPTRLTWKDAEAVCQAEQAHLTSVHSKEEQTFIAENAGLNSRTLDGWWIGLNDRDIDNTFVWSDGTNVSVLLWHKNEPNDQGDAEDCTEVWSSITWNDQSCDEKRRHICKKAALDCPSETTSDGIILTWLLTSSGTSAESVERCRLNTVKAGLTLAVRNCSIFGQWEDYENRSCGDVINEVTLEHVEGVDVGQGNVVEVAEFLAMQTSLDLDNAEVLEAFSSILTKIVDVRSGDVKVTKAVTETVSNVILAAPTSPDARNSSSIIRSLETQVSLTLQQQGQISVRQDSIHVEAVSLNFNQTTIGLTFASIRQLNDSQLGQGSSSEGILAATDIMTFFNISEIPNGVDVIASAQLPGNIVDFQLSPFYTSRSKFRASFLIYGNDTLFQSTLIREYQGENGSSLRVAAPVISLTVEDVDLVNLTEPVILEFKVPASDPGEELRNFQCVSWDFNLRGGVGDWSTAGCKLRTVTNDSVSCECNHATNFAILVGYGGQIGRYNTIARQALAVISRVGGGLSVVSLSVTLIIYLSIRNLRRRKSNQILINFCFSLLMLYIVFLGGIDYAKDSACVFVAALLHYLTLSTMMWMAVEGRNMYVSLVFSKNAVNVNASRYMMKACLIAWGSPLIVLGVTLATALDQYRNEHYCFLLPGLVLYLGLLLPIGLILIHNVITFILVMRSLLMLREVSRSQQIAKRLRNAVGISTLMGLAWSFGFLAIEEATFVFQFIFCLANSLQGVAIFIMFCVLHEEVRTTMAKYMKRICCGCTCRHRPPTTQPSSSAQGLTRFPLEDTSPSSM